MATAVVTRADPAHLGASLTEGYLTQPNMMAEVRRGPVHFAGTLNLEGYSLRRGELNAGIYGEGYIDRRHPHTFVHEAVLAVVTPSWRNVRLSLAGGKGFTPFGTDDPMMRPFVKYPVNHHHAQIIERVLAVGGVAYANARGSVALEHGVFNGDEPSAPFVGPQWSRFGDSHASRLTVSDHRGFEAQVSRAFVRSPGIVQGGAFDHDQVSAALRYMSHADAGARRYVMAEYARTDESLDRMRAFRFESVLAEAMLEWRAVSIAVRAEQTERPESERLLDPFRTQAGHIDFQIIGVTRWRVATVSAAGVGTSLPRLTGARVMPFVELALASPSARRRPTVFEPRDFYGGTKLASVSVGLRVHAGPMRSRMGRYGVLADALPGAMSHGVHIH